MSILFFSSIRRHTRLQGDWSSDVCSSDLETDVPIAGLLTDLKSRGLLDETLVVWGGEFGRTPFNEKGNGRDHNPWGFSMWLAGGGSRGGSVVGTTDEIGLPAAEDRGPPNDPHPTNLHPVGIDHLPPTYLPNGPDEPPTGQR